MNIPLACYRLSKASGLLWTESLDESEIPSSFEELQEKFAGRFSGPGSVPCRWHTPEVKERTVHWECREKYFVVTVLVPGIHYHLLVSLGCILEKITETSEAWEAVHTSKTDYNPLWGYSCLLDLLSSLGKDANWAAGQKLLCALGEYDSGRATVKQCNGAWVDKWGRFQCGPTVGDLKFLANFLDKARLDWVTNCPSLKRALNSPNLQKQEPLLPRKYWWVSGSDPIMGWTLRMHKLVPPPFSVNEGLEADVYKEEAEDLEEYDR